MRALVIVIALAGTAAADSLPAFPETKLADDEVALKGVFPSVEHWLASSGTPVTIQALVKKGKIIIRGYVGDKQQDLATSSFADASLSVFDHEDGKTIGVQLHRYITGAPDKYEGWNVELKGDALKVVRKTAFNGKQPQPQWLLDNIVIKNFKGVRRSVQVLRWAAYSGDQNAFGKYFDGEQVKVTWRTGDKTREETLAGTALVNKLANLAQVGHNATCKALCCTTDGAELAPYTHVAKVCFDGEPTDIDSFAHVRTIEIVEAK